VDVAQPHYLGTQTAPPNEAASRLLAVPALAVYKVARKHLNGGGWQLDARQFPSISLEMNTDTAVAFSPSGS
jgi:hypothetical protein